MFRFRLQRILELREQAEEARARQLADAQDVASDARRERDALEAVRQHSDASVRAAQQQAPRVGHLQQLGMVMQALDARVATAGQQVVHAESEVRSAQARLDDAARDRMVLDRLKDRHTTEWRAQEALKDRVGMDEIALARFTRLPDATERPDHETLPESSASPDATASRVTPGLPA
jgi:flagellar FliJ protein